MDEQKIRLKCKTCGGAFTMFLREMAEHNSKVTCPCCGQNNEYGTEEVSAAPRVSA